MEILLEKGIMRNGSRGFVDRYGNEIGFYRTKGVAKKRYMMDKYADIARRFELKGKD